MPVVPFLNRKRILWIAAVLLAVPMLALSLLLENMEYAPRNLGPYLERRALGHNAFIEGFGRWLNRTLLALDRGDQLPFLLPPLTVGRQAVQPVSAALPVTQMEPVVFVDSAAAARAAIQAARPGDRITFLPGVYHFDKSSIPVNQPGSQQKPITVRAQQPGTVTLLFAVTEGFKVTKPYWIFENLTIRGVCKEHSDCEHAFHVDGGAAYFIARNNLVTDFNAHFKINGDGIRYPDHGIIEGNTLSNTSVRQTINPVTPIDLVGASNWLIRGNLISDFIKGNGNRVSYGAFAKGGGNGNRFERNIVLCEHRLRGMRGQRVGLSFGGGGTGGAYCRDRRCITEHDGGSMENNLIASCSDDGIYLNRSAATKVMHNTLIDTSGITVRFATSSADIEGNIVDGVIRSRDDGLARAFDNITGDIMYSYLGWHPVRRMYRQAADLDLAWRTDPPRRNAVTVQHSDLCGNSRAAQPVYGAFDEFAHCLATPERPQLVPAAVRETTKNNQ